MSLADQDKWDQRYREGAYADIAHPSALLVDMLGLVSPGRALDVACGLGRNALYLETLGFQVDALDISAVALEQARQSSSSINWFYADLDDPHVLPQGPFDLAIMVRFVAPQLSLPIVNGLAPGGIVLIEQHLEWSADVPVSGPRGARFRVPPGQLAQQFETLELLHYSEGLVAEPGGGYAALARLVARNRASPV